MNDAKALAEIKRLAGLGRIRYTIHAEQRMDQRDVGRADIRAAIATAVAAIHQPDRGNWRIDSTDREGDELTVIVDIEADLVIVTIY